MANIPAILLRFADPFRFPVETLWKTENNDTDFRFFIGEERSIICAICRIFV